MDGAHDDGGAVAPGGEVDERGGRGELLKKEFFFFWLVGVEDEMSFLRKDDFFDRVSGLSFSLSFSFSPSYSP